MKDSNSLAASVACDVSRLLSHQRWRWVRRRRGLRRDLAKQLFEQGMPADGFSIDGRSRFSNRRRCLWPCWLTMLWPPD